MIDHRIQTFLTLCDTMNYRIAAEQLHITQPAVTQHIQYLEQYYGCKLFSYDGRRLEKTLQAEILERSAHAMLYLEENLHLSLQPQQGRHLSIGATKTIGEFVITEQISRYLADPDNHLTVEVDNTERILEQLDRGSLDFAIIEGFFDCSAYGSRLYRKEPFVGLCSKDHPLAGQTVAPDRLWQENLLLREEGSGTRQILERLLESCNHSIRDFRRITCISNFGLLEQLVADGSGITFAYAAIGKSNDKLTSFSVEGWEISREFNYVYLRDIGAEAAVDYFDAYR